MSKPDWATRIQKSRQKKYDEGFEVGVLLGYDLGRADMQDKFIKLLEDADSACSPWAIALIREMNG